MTARDQDALLAAMKNRRRLENNQRQRNYKAGVVEHTNAQKVKLNHLMSETAMQDYM